MIVGSDFIGDSIRIGIIQPDCYGSALTIIVEFAKTKHCYAETIIGTRNEFSELKDKLILWVSFNLARA